MKVKQRKAQRERIKLSQSNNSQKSINESQSQVPGTVQNNEISKKSLSSSSNSELLELNKNIKLKPDKEKEELKSLKNALNNNNNPINKPINPEEYKEQQFSKIATMFNFEVNKDKEMISIKENDEYYDMRNQIIELEKELEDTKKEYDDLIEQNEREHEMQKEQIEELENELKRHVDYNMENLKKENIILLRDVNTLDQKKDSINSIYKKEQYDINATISELDNTINKIKKEIYYVEDLKLRLKKLTNEDIPQELVNSINFNFNVKDDNEDIKDATDNSKFGIVKSKTGSIPIGDVLDISSFDSKRSVKKLYI